MSLRYEERLNQKSWWVSKPINLWLLKFYLDNDCSLWGSAKKKKTQRKTNIHSYQLDFCKQDLSLANWTGWDQRTPLPSLSQNRSILFWTQRQAVHWRDEGPRVCLRDYQRYMATGPLAKSPTFELSLAFESDLVIECSCHAQCTQRVSWKQGNSSACPLLGKKPRNERRRPGPSIHPSPGMPTPRKEDSIRFSKQDFVWYGPWADRAVFRTWEMARRKNIMDFCLKTVGCGKSNLSFLPCNFPPDPKSPELVVHPQPQGPMAFGCDFPSTHCPLSPGRSPQLEQTSWGRDFFYFTTSTVSFK